MLLDGRRTKFVT